MANIFMSFVGTGNYEKAIYTFDGNRHENRFVQKALLSMLKEKGVKYDKIIFFLTKEARAKNWEKYYREKTVDKKVVETEDEGLLPYLQCEFPDVEVKAIEIVSGENEEEIIRMFNTIYGQIGKEDTITFDITHGFRLMPFLFFPVMSYAKELKNISISHIYYGMYSNPQKEAPIVDLIKYNQILDWSNAAHNFIEFGNAQEISALADKQVAERHKLILDYSKFELDNSKRLAGKLRNFTNSVLTCRGGNVGNKNSIEEHIKDIEQYLSENSEKLSSADFPFFDNIMAHALESIEGFRGDKEPYEIGMATVKWCMDKGLVQQAYTALKETIITFFCSMYAPGVSASKELRENVVNNALNAAINCKPENVGAYRDYIKRLGANEKYQCIFVRTIKHILREKLDFINEINSIRNDINHFGMNAEVLSAYKIKAKLNKHYDKTNAFIENIKSRKDEILTDDEAKKEFEKYGE